MMSTAPFLTHIRDRAGAVLVVAAVSLTLSAPTAVAVSISTEDGLVAEATGPSLSAVALDGQDRAAVGVELLLIDPRAKTPLEEGFSLEAQWQAQPGCLRLEGKVTAQGEEDTVADLIVRVRGAQLALSTMAKDPLLQPAKLLSKLPLVSLRVGDQDELAVAVPPDQLALLEFRQSDEGVELRYPFGFTQEAKAELKMCAPFTCVLYRTEPRWHFRSALARYYELFPEPFEPFALEQGGWFFAAPTGDLPNPQHFYYHEGGPAGWDMDDERGMGTYPYKESSSYTISLEGSQLPDSYEEAMERFEALARQVKPVGWDTRQAFRLDETQPHSGERSLLADAGEEGTWAGVNQTIAIDPPVQEKILVKGFSRAQGVTGERDHNYAVYVDVVYAKGGYKFGQCATFSPGTHDWEESEYVIEPEEPVSELRMYCLLRTHRGKAWFDDIHIGPADDPATNWVENPGFEQASSRTDLQYIRDNVCHDSQDRYVFHITDNVGADVRPESPMNLLRFTLNVDPDIPDSEDRPSVAPRQFEYYDRIFDNAPSVEGCYIDSVSAWCSRVLNCRRDHWPYNDAPFSYDAESFRVGAHGRFAMQDYLGALQARYHPRGKPIFTNIHVDLNAFPLYLVSDVPGIESSLYRDEDSMFFYRASSYQKPLVLLNFMNLHDLDKRPFAELYHVNAAQWGEFPSTGRYVQRAYDEYGDVTHAYIPSIKELSAAGWEPISLASGARVERFSGEEAVYFTVRAPVDPGTETLLIEPEALAHLGDDLVACDTVWLEELALEDTAKGAAITFTHGARELHIVRISSRANISEWLVGRAREHALDASRVQGKASETEGLLAAVAALERPAPEGRQALMSYIAECRDRLVEAQQDIQPQEGDLFSLSRHRETQQAVQALTALVAFVNNVHVRIDGKRIDYPGSRIELALFAESPAEIDLHLLRFKAQEGVRAVPQVDPFPRLAPLAPGSGRSLRLRPTRPGSYHVRALCELHVPKTKPWPLTRETTAFVRPAATLSLAPSTISGEWRTFSVAVDTPASQVTLTPSAEPPATFAPESITLEPGVKAASFRVRCVMDGMQRTLTVRATRDSETVLGQTETSYWDEPQAPAADLALATVNAAVSAESSYGGGYSPEALIDGVTAVEGLHWTKRAWASRDNGSPHWIQIDLPEPARISRVAIYWNMEEGRTYTSSTYRVIGLCADGPRELSQIEDQQIRSVSMHEFEPLVVKGVRIDQPANGGPPSRPGIMWVREVCVLP